VLGDLLDRDLVPHEEPTHPLVDLAELAARAVEGSRAEWFWGPGPVWES
jgi:hypothetical protein